VARKLSDIQIIIDSSTNSFHEFVETCIDTDVSLCLKELSKTTDIYIFSGIIRNYFLSQYEMRDIDIVLSKEVNVEEIFKNQKLTKNSFGGYKIIMQNSVIDLWYLENTWAFQYQKNIINYKLEEILPNTAFFNFSSIIYSYNKKKFYHSIYFRRFLRDRKIDVVARTNPNNPLCVVNTFYYSDKFKLEIANNLKEHLYFLRKKCKNKYEQVQLKHFGRILYTNAEIEKRLTALSHS